MAGVASSEGRQQKGRAVGTTQGEENENEQGHHTPCATEEVIRWDRPVVGTRPQTPSAFHNRVATGHKRRQKDK
jgi:hypothetical protein